MIINDDIKSLHPRWLVGDEATAMSLFSLQHELKIWKYSQFSNLHMNALQILNNITLQLYHAMCI